LQGLAGDAGPTGPTGAIGIPGNAVNTGATGSTGFTGRTGSSGPTGPSALAGLDTQIQYNITGLGGATSNFTYEYTNNLLRVKGQTGIAAPTIVLQNNNTTTDFLYLGTTGITQTTNNTLNFGINVQNNLTLTAKSTIVAGHVVPSTTLTYDLGSPNYRWRDIYVSAGTIYLSTTALSLASDGNLQVAIGASSAAKIGTTTNPVSSFTTISSGTMNVSTIGVGTTTPLARINTVGGNDGNGTGGVAHLAFDYRNTGYRHFVTSRHNVGASVYNAVDFWINNGTNQTDSSAPGTNNSNILSITGTGIGVNMSTPTQALDVTGNIRGGGLLLKGASTLLGDWAMNIISTNTTSQAIIMGYSNNTNNAMDLHYWYTGNGASTNRIALGHYENGDILNVMASGNVGIGTQTPETKLHVNGTQLITHFATGTTSADAVLVLRNAADSSIHRIFFLTATNPGSFNGLVGTNEKAMIFTDGNKETGNLVIGPHSDSAFGIKVMSNGRVGIGVASPGYTLDVNGSINASVGVYSNGTFLTSDRRIKEDIEDANLDICYSNIKSLPLRRFAFVSSIQQTKIDGKQIGFIADEVNTVFPKSVTEFELNIDQFSTIKHVNFDQIFLTHYGATQKLISSFESLQQRHESTVLGFQNTIQNLESTVKEHNTLQTQINSLQVTFQTVVEELSTLRGTG
jgi:hypothetical protein